MNKLFSIPAVRLRNMLLLMGFLVISTVLVIAYYFEYIKGNRSLTYVVTYIAVLAGMMVLYIILYSYMLDTKIAYAYIAFSIYLIFHLYTMLTSPYCITFVYIYPMLMLAVMYGHQMLLTLITSVTLFNTIIACVVHVFLRKDYSLTEAEIAIACTFLVAIYSRFGQVPVLQSLNKIDKLEEETLIDTMTRCWNRKFLNNLIELDFFKSKDVSIILGDVNNFKSVNDTLGHTQGDVVLIRVGAQLKRICDMYDETWEVRIGGDEFIVVTKQKNVDELMQELYVACNTDETIMAMDIDIKVAFGKASNTTGKKTYQEMYEEADKEMYINKSKMKRSD